jgi:Domain of unknown function (DUF4330)
MILDSKGRLFGKISILDLGAALVILSVIIGIFFLPGKTGSIAQVNVQTKTVEIDLLVKGLSVKQPKLLIENMKKDKKINLIIRNEPHGNIEIVDVKTVPIILLITQPDGSVKQIEDPRTETRLSSNFVMTLKSDAQVTDTGLVIANQKLKIGTTVELDGYDYNFRGSVIEIRQQ